jgi:pilus assembly protein CpaE
VTVRRGAEAGQATVELVGLLPLLVAIALGVTQLLGAGAARELADHAAEAGAVALLQNADAADAARAAVPGWARERLEVAVRGRSVTVALTPPLALPALSDEITARATAHAGAGEG